MCFWPIKIASERGSAKDGFDACFQGPCQRDKVAQSRVTTRRFEIRDEQRVQACGEREFLER